MNRFNKNDDGIDTETALRISKLFKHKPTNIEHKKEKVVGHILTAGFSSYGDSRILTPDELNNSCLIILDINKIKALIPII